MRGKKITYLRRELGKAGLLRGLTEKEWTRIKRAYRATPRAERGEFDVAEVVRGGRQ